MKGDTVMDNEVRLDPFSITFKLSNNKRIVRIPKSETKIQYIEQFNLLKNESSLFVPLEINEEPDAYLFSYSIDKQLITWDQLKERELNERLRALYNISVLFELIPTRITFVLHPDNIVFDHNLMPKVIFRGISGLSYPYENNEAEVLKQFKSMIIEHFSEEYTFEDVYKGSIDKAANSTFTKLINNQTTLNEITQVVKSEFERAQKKTEQEQKLVPIKNFKLFKQVAIWSSVIAIVFLSLLIYTSLIRAPYQEKLLAASHAYLAEDYNEVIQILEDKNPEKLPQTTKYVLASSYLTIEQLSETEKETIMKNININSDKRYLLYWILNGSGDIERSIDIAKYIDDPTLIMYGLIKQMEQVKNNPDLSGDERDEQVRKLREELEEHVDEYELDIDTEEEAEYEVYSTEVENESSKDVNDVKSIKDSEKDNKEKKKKKKKKK